MHHPRDNGTAADQYGDESGMECKRNQSLVNYLKSISITKYNFFVKK